jgi:fluoride ion exporter CrcB/FEX
MAEAQGDYRRAFAWTVVGASAGSVARQWLQPAAPDFGSALVGIFALTAAAAVVIGILAVAPGRGVLHAVLAAAGGAAGSISAAAARAVTATPTQSFIGLGVFFAGAVTGLLVGMLLARAVADSERQERC